MLGMDRFRLTGILDIKKSQNKLLIKCISFLLLMVLWLPLALAQSVREVKAIMITHVTVIDVTGGASKSDMTVMVRDGRIADIERPAGKIRIDGLVVDGRGKFLIPGLWDMHVHTNFGDWIPGGKEIILPLFVANGITGVRDMGGDLHQTTEWRNQINAGTTLGPRMVISGPMLDGAPPHFPASRTVTTAEEGRKAVDDLKQGGVDFIKVQSYISRDAYFAVAEEAKKQGMTFVGHVPDAIRASEASNAGQKSVEHYTGIFEGCSSVEDQLLKGPKGPRRVVETYSATNCAALIKLLAKNGTWQVPTLIWERGQWLIDDLDLSLSPGAKYAAATWRNKSYKKFTEGILKEMDTDPLAYRQQFVAKELEMTLAMHRAGVPLMAGTDTAAGVYVMPGFSLHQELEMFVKAGLTPLEALQTATINPAKFLGRTGDLGTVEKGKLADLVLLDANPLDDIRNTTKISAVVLAGRYFSRADLDGILKDVEAAGGAK
jgi:imidazolonepropionase-like amidohydrolase